MATGIYRGRLAADGYGNLLAGEGENEGDPVAFHDGSFVFVQPGEPSHNERHHQQFVDVNNTAQALADGTSEGTEHHDAVLEDDAHYDENAPNKTRLRTDPDVFAAKITGHTDAVSVN